MPHADAMDKPNIHPLYFRAIYIALSMFAVLPTMTLPAIADAEGVPLYRVKRSLLGCWTHARPPQSGQRFPNLTVRCFQVGRTINRVSLEADGGANSICERWRVLGQNVVIWNKYHNEQSCLFELFNGRKSLTLSDCIDAGI